MNFDEDMVNKVLSSLNWSTEDENHTPSKCCASGFVRVLTFVSVLPPSDPDPGEVRSERQKSRLNKRKKVLGNLFDTRKELFEGEFDA